MRRIIDNKDLTKKVFHKRLLINFIVIFLILELILIPFSVASFTTSDGLNGDTKTTDTSKDPPAVGDLPSDTDSNTVVKDDTTTDSGTSTDVKDDTTTDSSSGTTIVDDSDVIDDKSIDTNSIDLNSDDKTVNSTTKTLFDDSNLAPNERIVSNDEIVSKSENSIGDLTIGVEIEVQLESFEDMDSVKLTPATDLEEVKVTVIKLKDKPEEIIDPPEKNASIYKYLDIKLKTNDTFVDEAEINSLEFNFKVEKTWITDNEIDKATVKLIRYHDGIWQNLSTTLNSENDTYMFYSAASPGFSTFAVVGSKVVEKSESYGTDELSIPWSIIIAFIMSLTIMLVIILFKARYIYLKDDSK